MDTSERHMPANADSIVMFEVTDLLTGNHYLAKDMGSYCDLHFRTTKSCIAVMVDREADLMKAAHEILNQLTM